MESPTYLGEVFCMSQALRTWLSLEKCLVPNVHISHPWQSPMSLRQWIEVYVLLLCVSIDDEPTWNLKKLVRLPDAKHKKRLSTPTMEDSTVMKGWRIRRRRRSRGSKKNKLTCWQPATQTRWKKKDVEEESEEGVKAKVSDKEVSLDLVIHNI